MEEIDASSPAIKEVVHFLRIAREDYGALRELSSIAPHLISIEGVDAAIDRAVDQRLHFAEELLLFAKSLDKNDSTVAARSKVSRLYYALHHALRSLLLFDSRGDNDSHRELIDETGKHLRKSAVLRSRFGDLGEFYGKCVSLMEDRQAADYDPLGIREPVDTTRNFDDIADKAVVFVEHTLAEISRYIEQRKSGVL